MALVVLMLGVIVVIAAMRNSQGALGTALMTDVPSFVTWLAALVAIGALGFVPSMRPVSRALMALVITVLIVRNYQAIVSGFQEAWKSPPQAVPGGTVAQTQDQGSSSSGGGSGGGGGMFGGSTGSTIGSVAEIAAMVALA